MDNLYQNNNPTDAQGFRGVVNGQQGTWVPVEADSVPFPVSNDLTNPSLGQDGSYYYAQGGAPTAGGFGPIDANRYNAIPTPSSIVQLPPIVQPIALVPYASQNQPMLQYDADYREEFPKTNLEPIYKAKPYAGLSVLCIVLAVVAVVAACLIACVSVGASAIDTIFGLLVLFGVGSFTSVYHTEVLSKVFADGLSEGFSANAMSGICALAVPILYILVIVMAVVAVIFYLVRLAKGKSPRCFNIPVLLGLIFSVVAIVLMVISSDMTFGIGAIITAVVFLVLLIVPFFARKGAQVIDYTASKRLYGGDN